DREIHGLQVWCVNVCILSMKPSSERLVQQAAGQRLSDVLYTPARVQMIAALLLNLTRDRKMRAAARQALREARSISGREILKALYTVAVASYFIGVLRQLRITHLHAHWATHPALAARVIREVTDIHFTFTPHAHDIFLP